MLVRAGAEEGLGPLWEQTLASAAAEEGCGPL